jgi:hypothetical protein
MHYHNHFRWAIISFGNIPEFRHYFTFIFSYRELRFCIGRWYFAFTICNDRKNS